MLLLIFITLLSGCSRSTPTGSTEDGRFEQTGSFEARAGQGEIIFPEYFESPPKVNLDYSVGPIEIVEVTATGFTWRDDSVPRQGKGGTWTARGQKSTSTDRNEAPQVIVVQQGVLDVPSGVATDKPGPQLVEGEVVFPRPYLKIPHVELKFNPGTVPGRDDGVIETTETGFKWRIPKSATGDWIANGRMESDSK
jgi:hypothetical protein